MLGGDFTGTGRRPPFRADRVVQPFVEFARLEAAGGLTLLAASIVALVWANSPWDESYADLWSATITLDLSFFDISETLHAWVNDGLMTLFFFVVGLEIKRELVFGELKDRRQALLPVAAALGGMIVPALIFTAFNGGREGQHGWGIPMATDIAFAVGVLTLAGTRAPLALRIFLLALAIADDIGAIAVIAIFYTDDLALDALALAVGLITFVVLMQRSQVRPIPMYAIIGVLVWAALLKSGVHATIAGVSLGLLTPTGPYLSQAGFVQAARSLVDRFAMAEHNPEMELSTDERRAMLYSMERLSRDTESPLERLERALHPWVSFGVVPIFALANAGVELSGDALTGAFESDVALGVIAGLVAGKPIGILLFSWLATATGAASLPNGVRWGHMLAASLLGGVGFTVSLFITELAFDDAALIERAKIGVLAASLAAGALGYVALRLVTRERGAPTRGG